MVALEELQKPQKTEAEFPADQVATTVTCLLVADHFQLLQSSLKCKFPD